MSSNFPQINHAITEDIKKELRLQGHYFTGALERSIQEGVSTSKDGLIIHAEALDYLGDLEKGIAPHNIDDARININKLADWVQIKSIWRGCTRPAAIAIAKHLVKRWKKEGFELAGAYRYTKTGKITDAIADTFEKNDARYTGMIDNEVIGGLDEAFNQIKGGTI